MKPPKVGMGIFSYGNCSPTPSNNHYTAMTWIPEPSFWKWVHCMKVCVAEAVRDASVLQIAHLYEA
jgi:hypothetical protein